MKKNNDTERKSAANEARAEDYRSPTVVTMTSAQLLEQVGPAQGYGGCDGTHSRRGRRGH